MSDERAASSYGPVTTTATAHGAGQAGLVNSAAGAAGALAGWAMSSLGKQLASTEVHSSMSVTSASSLAPPSINSNGASPASTQATSPRLSTDSGSFFSAPAFASTSKASSIGVRKAAPPVRQPPGMKLGGAKPETNASPSLADAVAGGWEDADEVATAWGTNDLIDVNADHDDWAGFESAPVPEIVVPPPQSYYVKSPQLNGKTSSSRSTPQPSPPKKSPVPRSTATFPTIPKPTASSPLSRSTPSVPSPPRFDEWADAEETLPGGAAGTKDSTQPSLAGMSKEEKDKEMARRREERKAVSEISALTTLHCLC